jgi:UDP-N-acetylglucosamine acyltransferase
MSVRIHPTAIVSSDVQLGADVEIGPFAIVGEGCTIGDGCIIAPRAMLERNVILGTNVKVGSGSILGGDPQDLKFGGEHTTVEIGDGTTIREYTTINRGTTQSYKKAIISGTSAAHQFVKIGKYAFVGGCSRISQDVPPFVKAVGNPLKLYGLNSVGLARNNFPEEVVHELKRAYRLFFRSELNVTQAKQRAATDLKPFPEVQDLLQFVEESGRGVVA